MTKLLSRPLFLGSRPPLRIGERPPERDMQVSVFGRAAERDLVGKIVRRAVIIAAEEGLEQLHVRKAAADHQRGDALRPQRPAVLPLDAGIGLAIVVEFARSAEQKSTRLNSSHYCASRMPSSA